MFKQSLLKYSIPKEFLFNNQTILSILPLCLSCFSFNMLHFKNLLFLSLFISAFTLPIKYQEDQDRDTNTPLEEDLEILECFEELILFVL